MNANNTEWYRSLLAAEEGNLEPFLAPFHKNANTQYAVLCTAIKSLSQC